MFLYDKSPKIKTGYLKNLAQHNKYYNWPSYNQYYAYLGNT